MTPPTTRTGSPAPPPAVSVQDASVVLGSTLILEAVSLTVTSGESVALLGANGSGKSTLVRTILGLVPPRTGSVRVFGADVSRRHDVDWGRIGYVPQRTGAASGVPATALEVVRSGLLTPRQPWADRGRRARRAALEALDLVGLAGRASEHVQVFSGGQAQRVMIARALVRQPDLLVLDEPLAGIDRASHHALAQILTDLRSQGLTLLTVLHEMGELAGVVDRAVVLSEGRIVAERATGELGAGLLDHHTHQVGDCEHHHPHGDTAPARHHSPDLTGSLPGASGTARTDQEATR